MDGSGHRFTSRLTREGCLADRAMDGKVGIAGPGDSCIGMRPGPRNIRKSQNSVSLVRARAVGQAGRRPDARVIPALVERLSDPDPVVRLAAHEELRKRTGRDFGYVPWANTEERAVAIGRWRDWASQGQASPARPVLPQAPPVPPSKALPVGSSQAPVP